MHKKMKWLIATAIIIAVTAIIANIYSRRAAHAQGHPAHFPRAPHCTNGTASGTYGYG